ncbi:WXG100 family type VII secretion target [Kitasatospora sp. NPDC058965]|uniref:WXG100 family type VII secretion target n=1 Tax=Kitasatospora sp. NPDC058965 TaxID=3346682 RepID=UPI0036AAAB9E
MTYTLQEFRVDLAQLGDTADLVRREGGTIREEIDGITTTLKGLEVGWTGPAAVSFEEIHQVYTARMGDLTTLLDDMASRLRTAYQTYRDIEEANTRNVSR